MREQGHGVIQNFGSISWHLPHTELALYMTAKAGVEALAQVEAHAADGFQARLRMVAGEAGEDQGHAPGVEVFRHADAQHFQVEVRKIKSQHLSALPFRQTQ